MYVFLSVELIYHVTGGPVYLRPRYDPRGYQSSFDHYH